MIDRKVTFKEPHIKSRHIDSCIKIYYDDEKICNCIDIFPKKYARFQRPKLKDCRSKQFKRRVRKIQKKKNEIVELKSILVKK